MGGPRSILEGEAFEGRQEDAIDGVKGLLTPLAEEPFSWLLGRLWSFWHWERFRGWQRLTVGK